VIAQTRHRIAVATVKAEMARAGFELVGQSDVLHRNDDDIEKLVFDPAVRGHTDRMLLKFRKK
jgi:predicted methyltransferase